MKLQYSNHSFQIQDTVIIEKENHLLKISGPLGHTFLNLKKIDPKGLGGISFHLEKKQLNKKTSFLDLENTQKTCLQVVSPSKSFFNLFKKLLENKIIGVTRGFLLYLKIQGIGYRATLNSNNLILKLGYSHDILYKIPSSIKIFLVDPTIICLFGVDKNQVTQIASKIRDLRPPSVYKGKGIRLLDEKVLIKQGKKK